MDSGNSIIYFQAIKAEAARILNENGWEGKFSVGGDVPECFQARNQHLSCLISLDNGLEIKIEEPSVIMTGVGRHNFFGKISCNFSATEELFRQSQHDFRRVFKCLIKEQLCNYETVPTPGQKRQMESQVEETPPPSRLLHTIHEAMEADGHARVPDQKGLDRIKEIKDYMQRRNMYKKFIADCNSLVETDAHLGRSLYESNYRLLASLAELAIREDVDDAMEADGHARLPDQKGLDRIKEIMDPVERRAAALKFIDVCNSLSETNLRLGRTDVYEYWGLAGLADLVANPPGRKRERESQVPETPPPSRLLHTIHDAMEADGHARVPDQKGLDRIKEIKDPVERRAAALKFIDVCNSLAETNVSLGRTDAYEYWSLAGLADLVANPPRRSIL